MGLELFIDLMRELKEEKAMKIHEIATAHNPLEKEMLERDLAFLEFEIWHLEEALNSTAN